MERDICIGGVEFSNPCRVHAYVKALGNACWTGDGLAPCCDCDVNVDACVDHPALFTALGAGWFADEGGTPPRTDPVPTLGCPGDDPAPAVGATDPGVTISCSPPGFYVLTGDVLTLQMDVINTTSIEGAAYDVIAFGFTDDTLAAFPTTTWAPFTGVSWRWRWRSAVGGASIMGEAWSAWDTVTNPIVAFGGLGGNPWNPDTTQLQIQLELTITALAPWVGYVNAAVAGNVGGTWTVLFNDMIELAGVEEVPGEPAPTTGHFDVTINPIGVGLTGTVYRTLVGTYTLGTDGPCPAPGDPLPPEDLSWALLDAEDALSIMVELPTEDEVGAVVACFMWRVDIEQGGIPVGSLYLYSDPGEHTTTKLVRWEPLVGAIVDWAELAEETYEFSDIGAVTECGPEDAGALNVYTTPAGDNAPWYDPADPRSADVLGVWVDDLTLSSPHRREAADRQWGGTLTANRLGRRELTIGGRVYIRSKAAAEYARQWMYEVLVNSPCGDNGCHPPDVELLSYCDPEDPLDGVRTLHEVGLTDWQWNLDNTDPLHCLARFTATLASKVPWLTKAATLVHTGLVLQGVAYCDVCGNMTDVGECPPTVEVDPLALQCGCTDQPARTVVFPGRSECYVRPMYVARHFVALTNPKLWTDGALRLTIDGGIDGIDANTPSLKNLRFRLYPNPMGLPVEQGNDLVCTTDPCAEVAIGCVPYGATMVIDGSTRRATVSVPGLARSANPYLSSVGGKFTYPEYSCGDLMLAVDVDALMTTPDSTFSVETIEIERG